MFFRRRRCCWTVVKRQRWRVLIDNLIWCGVVEETIHPLVTFGGLIPVTGNPLLTRWNRAPYAAHPKVFAGVFVPPPVARDPNNILAFRFVLRRDLIDRCRRSRRDHDAQGRVGINLLSKCLMDRSARQFLGLNLRLIESINRRCIWKERNVGLSERRSAQHEDETG